MRPPGDDGPTQRTLPTSAVREDVAAATRLLVFGEQGPVSHTLPDEGVVTIGRSKECDVGVDHPSMSRKHATLTLGAAPTLEDLESFNGTRISGRRLEPRRPEPVPEGAVIELGSVMMVLKPRAPRATARAAERGGGMKQVERLVDVVAASTITVVLLGETGVGKTVIASEIHERSPRASQPFLQLNCAALPENLLEAELYGYERGAFTGATAAKTGFIEAAHGGTLFLDEIGELPLLTQAKLLHVLENGEVLRIGSVRPRAVDVRFVAATNRDLVAMVEAGAFRSDLYHRMNGISITIPPLRERTDEIARLAVTLLERAAAKSGAPPPALTPEAVAMLERHAWPGNVRELRNVLERAALLSQGNPIGADELVESGLQVSGASAPEGQPDLRAELGSIERQRIADALDACGGNQTLAAQRLGISRRTLINRLEQYDLPRPRKGGRRG